MKNKKTSKKFTPYTNCVSIINTTTLSRFAILLVIQLFFFINANALSQIIDKSNTSTDSSYLKTELYNKNLAFNLQEYNATLISEAQEYIQQKGINHITNSDFKLITYLLYHALESKNISQANSYYTTLEQLANLSAEQKQIVMYWEARLLYENKNYKAAIKSLKQNELLHSTTALNKHYQIKTWYCIALCYHYLHEYEFAIDYFNKSLSTCKEQDDFYYKILHKIAFSNYRLGHLTEAIKSIDNNIPDTVSIQHAELDLWQAKLLQLRAFFYREIATNADDSLFLLKKSLADCELSIPYLSRYLQHQYLENDQLKLNQKYNYFYYKTIEAISRVYNSAPSETLLFKALHYAELDKNRVLMRYLNKQKAKQTLNIPSGFFTELDSLYNALETSKGDYYILNKQKLADNNYKQKFYRNKQQLIQAIHSKENNIKQLYPEYALMCNALPDFNTEFVKELSYKQQIIEYMLSDEKVYAFLINKGTIYSYQCKLDKDLLSTIQSFRQLTSNNNALNDNDSTFFKLANTGYALYHKILEPLVKHMDTKPLLIIPDNELNLIAFEALLSEPYNNAAIEYSELPYLLNKFEISYANSLQLLQQQLEKPNSLQTNGVLSYVPNYNELGNNKQHEYIAMRNAYGHMSDLIGAREEVEHLSKKTNTVLRRNKQASENDFINMIDKYSVIHCAMHTLIDNDNPQYSKMLFTPNADTVEDGLLHTYEIPKLQLDCDLLVLSACNTAYGIINNGEGLLSLSRAFTKSGSKSILSTLWSIPDISSVHIIDEFYNGLIKHKTKSESLWQAKRHYLNEHAGIKAHPFFWAGHIITGNNTPLVLKATNTSLYKIIFACSFGLLIFIVFLMKRF